MFVVEIALGTLMVAAHGRVADELHAWNRRTWGRWALSSRAGGRVVVVGVGVLFILFGTSGLLDLDPTIPFLVLFVGIGVLGTWAHLREQP